MCVCERVCIVFQSTFELSFSHRHANKIVRFSNCFSIPKKNSFVFFYSLSSYGKKKWWVEKSFEWTTPKWNRNVRKRSIRLTKERRKEEKKTINHQKTWAINFLLNFSFNVQTYLCVVVCMCLCFCFCLVLGEFCIKFIASHFPVLTLHFVFFLLIDFPYTNIEKKIYQKLVFCRFFFSFDSHLKSNINCELIGKKWYEKKIKANLSLNAFSNFPNSLHKQNDFFHNI